MPEIDFSWGVLSYGTRLKNFRTLFLPQIHVFPPFFREICVKFTISLILSLIVASNEHEMYYINVV